MLVRLIYTILLTVAAPFLLLGLYRSKPNKPKFGARWKEHFGITPALNSNQPPIWIHAVSVGESIAATPLIKAIKKQQPEQVILVTTTTSTGAEQIAKLGDLVEHRYMPLDFSFAVNRFIKTIKPLKLLIIETELWPNTLNCMKKNNISVNLVNARLSEKSCQGYKRIQPLFTQVSSCLTQVLCQTKDDASRFMSLGVKSEKVHVTGSIKYDIDISEKTILAGTTLRENLGKNRPIWIAASTHKGEDEKVLAAHKMLLKVIPNALLILVPRHPERFNQVYSLCESNQFTVAKRTNTPLPLNNDCSVYLADTMGEMLTLMGASDVCFMGGSLLGDKVGGHNMLEPAALGLPTITGPSYFNFQDISEQLMSAQHLSICNDSQQLTEQLIALFNSQDLYQQRSNAGLMVVKNNSGALTKTLTTIL